MRWEVIYDEPDVTAGLRWEVTPEGPQEGDRVRIICTYEELLNIGLGDLQYGDEGTVQLVDPKNSWWDLGSVDVLFDRDVPREVLASFPFKDWQKYLEIIPPATHGSSTSSLLEVTGSSGLERYVHDLSDEDLRKEIAERLTKLRDPEYRDMEPNLIGFHERELELLEEELERRHLTTTSLRWEVKPEFEYLGEWMAAGAPPIPVGLELWGGFNRPGGAKYKVVHDNPVVLYLHGQYYRYFPLSEASFPWYISHNLARVLEVTDPLGLGVLPDHDTPGGVTTSLRWEVTPEGPEIGDTYVDRTGWITKVVFVGTLQDLIDKEGVVTAKRRTNNSHIEFQFDELDRNMTIVEFNYYHPRLDPEVSIYWDPENKFVANVSNWGKTKIASRWEVAEPGEFEAMGDDELIRTFVAVENSFIVGDADGSDIRFERALAAELDSRGIREDDPRILEGIYREVE